MSNKLKSFVTVLVSIVVVMAALPLQALKVNAATFTLTVETNDETMGTAWIGGYDGNPTSLELNGDTTNIQIIAQAKSGYCLIRFERDGKPDDSVALLTGESSTYLNDMDNKAHNYKAIFGARCSVTAESNDPSMGSVYISGNDFRDDYSFVDGMVTFTATPASESYKFVGWKNSSDEVINENASFETKVTGDVHYIACFERVTPRTITFEKNKPTSEATVVGEMLEQVVADGVTTSIKENKFACTGYVFKGWKLNDATTGDFYTDKDNIKVEGSDITLYAQWEEGWVVSFNANGGSETLDPVTVTKGSSYTVPDSTSITREGYRLTGWTINTADGTFVSAGSDISSVTSDMTLIAQWQQIYTITYDANGGTGSLPDQTFDVGSSDKVTVADPGTDITKQRYVFLGWKDDAGKDYAPNTEFTPESDITLYAQWQRTITLHANDGSDATKTQTAPVGATPTICPIADTSFTAPSGKQFVGWTTAENSTTVEYADKASVTITGNDSTDVKDLYALWSVPVAITFDKNSDTATGGPMASITSGIGLTTKLPDNKFSLAGNSFGGWKVADGVTGVTISKDGDNWVVEIQDTFTGTEQLSGSPDNCSNPEN